MKTSAATTEATALVFDRAEIAAARKLAVLVPGALCRVGIFEAAEAWRAAGYGLAVYRFPGLDGRPLRPPLRIAQAAGEIADFAARHPDTPLRLVGFSTGGPIVFEAAAALRGDVKVAALSPAAERGGGIETGVRSLRAFAGDVLRSRALRLEVAWHRHYRQLLFGGAVLHDRDLARRADAIIAARRSRIVLPTPALLRAHTRDLRRWHLPAHPQLAPGQVHFFRGALDTVFSAAQTERLAAKIGAPGMTVYPGIGHLLFAAHPQVFDDVLAFFETPWDGSGQGVRLRRA